MLEASLKRSGFLKSLCLFVIQMRPRQWTKNFLVFAALLFSLHVATINMVVDAVYGFIIFSLVSSCVYIFNDFMDRDADRLHPAKKYRPMASGALNPPLTFALGGVILGACLLFSLRFSIQFSLLLVLYVVLNVLYSMALKHVVILDVMIVASGFVIRAISGAVIIQVVVTPWFFVCILFLSLFLATGKRSQELALAATDESDMASRKVLQFYNKELLGQMNSILTTATLISYALFTFTSGRTLYLMWTIPLVFYGIFRYLYLIYVEGKGGEPDKLLFEDKHILGTVFLYVVSVVFILGFLE